MYATAGRRGGCGGEAMWWGGEEAAVELKARRPVVFVARSECRRRKARGRRIRGARGLDGTRWVRWAMTWMVERAENGTKNKLLYDSCHSSLIATCLVLPRSTAPCPALPDDGHRSVTTTRNVVATMSNQLRIELL
jgi:hypothetical protein